MDHGPRVPSIMVLKPFYVFQKKCGWPLRLDDSQNVKKQCALSGVFETFTFTDAAKRLTWESRHENIKIGYLLRGDFGDVAVRYFPEIGGVSFLTVLIPLRGENAFKAVFLER